MWETNFCGWLHKFEDDDNANDGDEDDDDDDDVIADSK